MKKTKPHKRRPENAKSDASREATSVIGPETATIPKEPEAINKPADTKEKRRWTQDPGLFGVSVAALVVAIIGTGVAACLVVITQEGEINQLRAYIDVADPSIVCVNCDNPSFVPPQPVVGMVVGDAVVIWIHNGGQTPARVLQTNVSWYGRPYGARLEPNFKWPEFTHNFPNGLGTLESKFTIGKDARDRTVTSLITAEDYRPIILARQHRATTYVYGRVDYCDIYHRAHRKLFCYAYQPGLETQFVVCDRHTEDQDTQGNCTE